MIELAIEHRLDHPAGPFSLQIKQIIETGAFLSLFGESGAGKTSILRSLAGLTKPDSGRIVVNGVVWFDSKANIHLAPRRRKIGIVFQDYALFPHLSVRENVAYGAARGEMKWIDELLSMIRLTAVQSNLPGTLSGGQKQRVALARAVARKPLLLLLDEPLSALDNALRLQLRDDIALLHKRLDLTTILVSHDIGEVFRLSSTVWVMNNGKIERAGAPASVFLPQRIVSNLTLTAQGLSLKRDEVITVVSLLVGQDIIDMVAPHVDVVGFRIGDVVTISAKTFGAARLDRDLLR